MSLREHFPDYFSRVPGITVYDPLAELLGAPADGLLRYQFSDAVRLAGHACPTVASAWLATTRALARLYPECLPQRGNIGVALAESEESGVAGVIASVAGLLSWPGRPAPAAQPAPVRRRRRAATPLQPPRQWPTC